MAVESQNLLDKVLSNFQTILGRVKYQVLFDLADFVTFLIVFVGAWIVSLISKNIVRKILNRFEIEKHINSLKLSNALGDFRLSDIIENIAMWYFLLIILQMTTPSLQLGLISHFLSIAYRILPGLFSFIILFCIGILGGEYVSNKVKELRFYYRDHVALLGKLFIIYLSVYFSISRFGVNLMLINNIFIIILVALLIVLGVSFGYSMWYTKSYVKEKRKQRKEEETEETE